MLIALSVILFNSCSPEDSDELIIDESYEGADYLFESEMILGDKKEITYTIENMQRAFSNLSKTGRLDEDFSIETTDLYVRFLPADTTDIKLLKQDTSITLFDHPLDFEIEQIGSWYHDPSIADSLPTWQYTVVDVKYNFPLVKYEVLANLFMVDEDDDTMSSGRISQGTWERLEEEALRISGNLDEENLNSGRSLGRWRPAGCLRVEENSATTGNGKMLPIEGVEVIARRGLKFSKKRTDRNGCFSMNLRFRNSVKYSVKWEVINRYRVANPYGLSRTYNRPGGYTKSRWQQDIRRNVHGREVWTEATVAKAIREFHRQAEEHRIKVPGLHNNIKIRLKYGSKSSNVVNGSFRHNPIYPVLGGGTNTVVMRNMLRNDVKFYVERNDGTSVIFRVMMHELGHMSHILEAGVNFQFSYVRDPMLVESWAECTEYYFTKPYYPNSISSMPDQTRRTIIAGGTKSWQYTPFFIDLKDGTNQSIIRPYGATTNDYANDNVAGYGLERMLKALDNRTTLRGVQEFLINNYNYGTENNIERMRDFYENIKDNHD